MVTPDEGVAIISGAGRGRGSPLTGRCDVPDQSLTRCIEIDDCSKNLERRTMENL
jgi:hypothetical protein